MTVIILAAGQGVRLSSEYEPKENYITKCLVDINGQTALLRLIDQIRSLTDEKIIVVCGHKKENVQEILINKNIKLIYNNKFKKDTNLFSLYIAIKDIEDHALIIEADSVFSLKHFEKFYKAIIFLNSSKSISVPLSLWSSIGIKKSFDTGGFINIKSDFPIYKNLYSADSIEISSSPKDNAYKMFGITYFSKALVKEWLKYSEDLVQIYNNSQQIYPYFHYPFLNGFFDEFLYCFDFEDFPIAFNTYKQLLEARHRASNWDIIN